MGAWGELAFDNDTANDWANGLEEVDDLSLVKSVLEEVAEAGDDYLDADVACEALAACEVIARLQGNAGYKNPYTEAVDEWVEAHKIKPSPALIASATAALDRILGEQSELRQLWEEGDATAWLKSVEDLRSRLGP